jgi:serine phosphatase RsbU (regulator of sigma subunit)
MAGRWDSAIDYLEVGILEGDVQAREDLLPATINSMYASEGVSQAAHFLARGLTGGFDVTQANVWTTSVRNGRLRLVARFPFGADNSRTLGQEILITADLLESRACQQVRALRGAEGDQYVWRAIPLVVTGRQPIGVVTLCDCRSDASSDELRERDLRLAGYLNQAARALAAVGTRRQELAQAGHLQAGLLPTKPPALDGWQIASTWQPARETSGDFFDFILLPGGRLGIVIADVADKGIGAALYMALSRTLIRTFAADHPGHPGRALEAASQRILAETEAGLFVTVFYGVLDPQTGSLTYCNAGHHPPYLFDAQDGGHARPLPGRGMALGVVKETSWGQTTIELQPGATLLLYTDGVIDAHNPEQARFGDDGLLSFLRAGTGDSAQGLLEGLVNRLQQFAGGEPQFDDITLVAVQRER